MELTEIVQNRSLSNTDDLKSSLSKESALQLHGNLPTQHVLSSPQLQVVSSEDETTCDLSKAKKSTFDKGKIFGNGKLHPTDDRGERRPGESKRPSSAASARWKLATNVVTAANSFKEEERKKEKTPRNMQGSKACIPVLPLPLAVFLLICNSIIPGLGTICSGFTFCCIATTFEESDREVLKVKIPGLVTTNLCVGVCQLFTTTFLLVGWFWSVSWGITMVYLAIENRERNRTRREQRPDVS